MCEPEKLKSCPFCGTIPVVQIVGKVYYDIECIECQRASTSQNYETKEEAIKDWNTRTDSSEDKGKPNV